MLRKIKIVRKTIAFSLFLLLFTLSSWTASGESPEYSFTVLPPQSLGEWTYYDVRFADLSGDGRIDIVLSGVRSGPTFNQNHTYVALGGKNGRFTLGEPNIEKSDWRYFSYMDTGDINNDQKDDVIWNSVCQNCFSNGSANFVRAAIAGENGALDFQPEQQLGTSGWDPYQFRAGDVTGDGTAELIWNTVYQAPVHPNHVYVAKMKEQGGFELQPLQTVGTNGWSRYNLTTADVNGDARLDLVWSTVCPLHDYYYYHMGCSSSTLTGYIAFGLGQEDGTFKVILPQELPAGNLSSYLLHSGDVNGDGRDELVLNTISGGANYLYLVTVADSGKITFSDPIIVGETGWIRYRLESLADLNGDGSKELIWNSTCQAIDTDRKCTSAHNYIYIGSFDENNQFTLSPRMEMGQEGDALGKRLWTRSHDIDGDGRDDLLWTRASSIDFSVLVALSGQQSSRFYIPMAAR